MITFKQFISEEIKGWKHAQGDLMKRRALAGKEVRLVKLKKDGSESGMHDATKMFRSEEDAREHHEKIKKLNPGKNIAHNLYVGDKTEKLS